MELTARLPKSDIEQKLDTTEPRSEQDLLVEKYREKNEYRPTVSLLVRSLHGSILFCKSAKNEGSWHLPQGGIDKGESIKKTLLRELDEELRIPEDIIQNIIFLGITEFDANGIATRDGFTKGKVKFSYSVNYNDNTPMSPQEGEIEDYKWVLPADIETLLSDESEEKIAWIKSLIEQTES